MKYKKHVFVCENIRTTSNKKSCGEVGQKIRMELKREVERRQLKDTIRINKSGCLGKCGQGPCVVVYPQGNWYFNAKFNECEKIFEQLVAE